jgi:hypothetical protein
VRARDFVDGLAGFIRAASPPEAGSFRETVQGALDALRSEPPAVRPPDHAGRPGGLLQLDRGVPTVVVPDIHGRRELLLRVLGYRVGQGARTLALLARGRIQILCLGDGMHAEGRAARRWRSALGEFRDGWRRHDSMDEEMTESLGVMGIVMEAKRAFPGHFHFLKGNHENITNEEGGGNYPFRKFALEGLMVVSWMRQFYGEELLASLASFEKELPLLAVGNGFLASHAEPRSVFPRERVIEGRGDAEVVAGLTWTDNGESEPGTVEEMLRHYLGTEGRFYFAGHRAVDGDAPRPGGPFVQLHDPARMTMAWLEAGGEIDLEAAIRRLAGDADAG